MGKYYGTTYRKNHLNIIMPTLTEKLQEIAKSIPDWESSNNYVHHEVITKEELEEITSLEEIKNKITVL